MGICSLGQSYACLKFYGERVVPWEAFGFYQNMCFAPSVSVYLLQPHSWSGNDRCVCAPASGLYHHSGGSGYLHGIPHQEQCTSGAPTVKPRHTTRDLVLAGELGLGANTPGVKYL